MTQRGNGRKREIGPVEQQDLFTLLIADQIDEDEIEYERSNRVDNAWRALEDALNEPIPEI